MNTTKNDSIIFIESKIYELRNYRVMLDFDLAEIYGVSTKRLNEQVKRNRDRFPSDFMFSLNKQEVINLRSQIATSSLNYGGRRTPPNAFTEHGALMVANVLNSKTAVSASIQVVRTFNKLREMVISHADLSHKINEMEKKYDAQFRVVFDHLKALLSPPQKTKRQIGFMKNQQT